MTTKRVIPSVQHTPTEPASVKSWKDAFDFTLEDEMGPVFFDYGTYVLQRKQVLDSRNVTYNDTLDPDHPDYEDLIWLYEFASNGSALDGKRFLQVIKYARHMDGFGVEEFKQVAEGLDYERVKEYIDECARRGTAVRPSYLRSAYAKYVAEKENAEYIKYMREIGEYA